MHSTNANNTVQDEVEAPLQFLVETQGPPGPGDASRFLRAARHIAAARTRTDVFLIEDGIGYVVDATREVTGVLDAGGRVWADEMSLSDRGIKAKELIPGIMVADLDAVAELLFDPTVQVVWH